MPPKILRYKHGWRVNFTHNGVKHRKRFPGDSDAYAAAQDYIQKIIYDFSGLLHKKGNISELVREYHNWSEAIRGKAKNTLNTQQNNLRIFQQWTQAAKIFEAKEISADTIRRFQSYYFENAPFYRKQNHQLKSNHRIAWNICRQVLAAWLNWCKNRGHIKSNPATLPEFRLPVEDRSIKPIKNEELRQIFDWLDKYDSGAKLPYTAFFRILLYTGMRRNEAIYLKWKDVDLRNRQIHITKTKTRKPRIIPINSRLMTILKSLPTRENEYVLDNGNNQPIYSERRYWKVLRMATDASALRQMRIHDFRHTFGSNLAAAGVPLPIIAKLMGHSNIRQTMVYVDFYPEHLHQSIEKLDFEGME